MDVKHKEDHTTEEQAEENSFLSLAMETRVMKKAYEFCLDKGRFLVIKFSRLNLSPSKS